MSYTTKQIEGELSLDKEYVLVDVARYKKSHNINSAIIDDLAIDKPFELSSVDKDGDGFIGDNLVIQVATGERVMFKEVIRKQQTNEFNTDSIAVTEQEEEAFNAMSEVELKNGDTCIWRQNGKQFKFVGMHCDNKSIAVVWNGGNDYRHCNIDDLQKPETQEQREERERLEAAYYLYCVRCNAIDWEEKYTFDEFKSKRDAHAGWLAVIDKTNYRK